MNDFDYFGAIDVSSEYDYRLGKDTFLPKPRKTFEDFKIQYNQKEVGKMSCSIHASMGTVSDLTGHAFTLEQRETIWRLALGAGADPNEGWSVKGAVDLLRHEGTDLIERLMTFRVTLGSEDFFKVLDAGYSVVTGFRGNSQYNKDKKDGELDLSNFGATTYGHIIRIVKGDDLHFRIVDNYSDGVNQNNIYKIEKDNLPELIKNEVFFKNCYIFVYKKDYDEVNEESKIPLWGLKAYQKAKAKGWDIENLDEVVGTAKLENTLIDLGVFTGREGKVTKLRWYVALDRMGLI